MPLPFTPRARRAIAHAKAFARRQGEIERFPGTELVLGFVAADHLLLGVAHPEVDADIWSQLGLDSTEVYAALEQALVVGVWPPPPTDAPVTHRPTPVDVQMDASAVQALEYAAAEAKRLRHPEIRPEHLLLGALRAAKPGRRGDESLGRLALATFGVTLESVFIALLS